MRPAMGYTLILATLLSAGCHTMKPVGLHELAAMRPGQVWVTRADQSVVLVSGPQALGDTLVGYVNGQFEEMLAADLKQMVLRTQARGRTVALVVAGTAGFAGFTYLLMAGGAPDYVRMSLDCEEEPNQAGCT